MQYQTRELEPSMIRIPLDSQDDSVKRFFLSLATGPQGAVVELEGRAIVHVLPASRDNDDEAGDWTEERNARRCELIDREIDGTLTHVEAVELERLQREMLSHRRRVAPLPLADARKLHQELMEKANRAASGK